MNKNFVQLEKQGKELLFVYQNNLAKVFWKIKNQDIISKINQKYHFVNHKEMNEISNILKLDKVNKIYNLDQMMQLENQKIFKPLIQKIINEEETYKLLTSIYNYRSYMWNKYKDSLK